MYTINWQNVLECNIYHWTKLEVISLFQDIWTQQLLTSVLYYSISFFLEESEEDGVMHWVWLILTRRHFAWTLSTIFWKCLAPVICDTPLSWDYHILWSNSMIQHVTRNDNAKAWKGPTYCSLWNTKLMLQYHKCHQICTQKW